MDVRLSRWLHALDVDRVGKALGDRADRFEADLRGALLACEPDERFVCIQRFGYTLGRKDG